jgi:hypothetical protein
VSTVIFSLLSDHYRQRAIFIAIQACAAIVGWGLTGFGSSGIVRYGGNCLNFRVGCIHKTMGQGFS